MMTEQGAINENRGPHQKGRQNSFKKEKKKVGKTKMNSCDRWLLN
jgi:hypothetical protein